MKRRRWRAEEWRAEDEEGQVEDEQGQVEDEQGQQQDEGQEGQQEDEEAQEDKAEGQVQIIQGTEVNSEYSCIQKVNNVICGIQKVMSNDLRVEVLNDVTSLQRRFETMKKRHKMIFPQI